MQKITLGQILQYYDEGENELIHVVTEDRDWDEPNEVYADSEFLKPFRDYIVVGLRAEWAFRADSPVIRVMIEKGDNNGRLEEKADKQEVLGGGMCAGNEPDHCIRWDTGNGGSGDGFDYGWSGGYSLYHWRGAGGCSERGDRVA